MPDIREQATELYRSGRFIETAELLAGRSDPQSLIMRGMALAASGRHRAAIECQEQALNADPALPVAWMCRAESCLQCGRIPDAIESLRKVLSLTPEHAAAANSLASLLHKDECFDEAEQVCRQTLKLIPGDRLLKLTLANVLADSFRIAEACELYLELFEQYPESFLQRSNFLMFLNYPGTMDNTEISAWHRKWDHVARHAHPDHKETRPPSGGDRVRIGYLSQDFRTHSVAYFFEPLLHAHDRDNFEIHCFHDNPRHDDTTERIRANCECWHETAHMDSNELCEYLRNVRLDILIDLAGHSSRRMEVFSRRSAPIQISYLGYPNTTGIKNMDYRVTDELADPPGSGRLYTERLIRVPGGMWAYAPSIEAPEPGPQPCTLNPFFTFGSFNNLNKLSDSTIAAWSRILQAIPDSKLLLKDQLLRHSLIRDCLLMKFAEHGIGDTRLILMPQKSLFSAHFATYRLVDLALDPFPYNGTTTTFEAMWMGVPVLTLKGTCHAGRVGNAIMSRVGLSSFVADDIDSYVNLAIACANKPSPLAELRPLLRGILADSPLLNPGRLTRSLEKFYIESIKSKKGENS